jgi:branched-chain amino acid transport system permease protein
MAAVAAALGRLAGLQAPRWLQPAIAAGFILLAAGVPLVTSRPDTLNLFFLMFLYITLSQSWNILGGFAGQVSLGHAAFFGTGALACRTLWTNDVPFVLAFPAGGVAAMAFALLIGVPTFRLQGVYFALGTLALASALHITVGNVFPRISALPLQLIVSYDLGQRYYLALGLAVATTLAAYLLLRSRVGLGILAVREDEDAARASGIDPVRHKLLALALSSLFAGLAGSTFAYHEVSIYPSNPFNPIWGFDAIVITFVGGLGTLIGPMIGAAAFTLIREQLAVTLVQVHQEIFGALFILVVLLLPGGLADIWSHARRALRRLTA